MSLFSHILRYFQAPPPTLRQIYPDFLDTHITIIQKIQPFTMTNPERIHALMNATEYIVNQGIEGDIVECGVWKGGSMMAIIEMLILLNCKDKKVIGFDTFDKGMSAYSEWDITYNGRSAAEILTEWEKTNVYAKKVEVERYLHSADYPSQNIQLVEGEVKDTIPTLNIPKIALLRLDTDWYESTKFEMEQLYDKLVMGGIIIIDDYGYWQGAKKAVDEFFVAKNICLFWHRVDHSCRIALKTH